MKYELMNNNDKKLYDNILNLVLKYTDKCILERCGIFQDIVLSIDNFKYDRYNISMVFDFIHAMIKEYKADVLISNNNILFGKKGSSIIITIQCNNNDDIKIKCFEIIINSLYSRY